MSKKTPKKPPHEDASRCLKLRKQSKQGVTHAKDDIRFVERMFQLYPDWYASTEVEVISDTAPFGSNVRREP